MKHSYGKKLKLNSKATPNKVPITTQRGNDGDSKAKKQPMPKGMEKIKI